LVGFSILLAPLLRLIPTAVIFGVFLYLGIASLSGIDFFERIGLIFLPSKHHPPTSYTRHVTSLIIILLQLFIVFLRVLLNEIKCCFCNGID
jgi:hypothetical protein